MADGEATLGEVKLSLHYLAQGLSRLETHQSEQFQSLTRKVDSLSYVPRGEYVLQISNVVERLEALEEAKQWTTRALVTALIYPIIVAAITFAALALSR